MMRNGAFREDLYYRLQVIELRVPSLRERPEEIPPLVEFFLSKYARVYRRPAVRPSPVLMEAIADHTWPGNIRELENMVKRYVVLQEEGFVLSELARLRQIAVEMRQPVAVGSRQPALARSAPGHRCPREFRLRSRRPRPSSRHHRAASRGASSPNAAGRGSGGVERTDQPAGDGANGGDEGRAARRSNRRYCASAGNCRKTAEHLSVSYKTLLRQDQGMRDHRSRGALSA